MFADEKGYLVTEMKWEEVTDDESALPMGNSIGQQSKKDGQQSKKDIIDNDDNDDKKISNKNLPKKQTASKKGPEKPPVKNMMSFFGKK